MTPAGTCSAKLDAEFRAGARAPRHCSGPARGHSIRTERNLPPSRCPRLRHPPSRRKGLKALFFFEGMKGRLENTAKG